MSRMADLEIEIMEMLEDGMSEKDISSILRIPMEWIEIARKSMMEFAGGEFPILGEKE